jgi:hypothetical protein
MPRGTAEENGGTKKHDWSQPPTVVGKHDAERAVLIGYGELVKLPKLEQKYPLAADNRREDKNEQQEIPGAFAARCPRARPSAVVLAPQLGDDLGRMTLPGTPHNDIRVSGRRDSSPMARAVSCIVVDHSSWVAKADR